MSSNPELDRWNERSARTVVLNSEQRNHVISAFKSALLNIDDDIHSVSVFHELVIASFRKSLDFTAEEIEIISDRAEKSLFMQYNRFLKRSEVLQMMYCDTVSYSFEAGTPETIRAVKQDAFSMFNRVLSC